MKNIKILALFILFISCNKEDANDCFQTAGEIISTTVNVEAFEKIVVHEHIALIITQGPEQKVELNTGKNLVSDISFEVINNELIIRNHNTCNFVRDYDDTKVYITAPNLTQIRNASELSIRSNGTLTYPNLYLQSLGNKKKFLAVGDWFLNIENDNLRILSNGIAILNIEGTTNNLDLNFSDGDTRFNGKNLIAKNVKVRNVSSNDMLVYPTESLTGTIHSTGNVISYNTPTVVSVEELSDYGKLIFK